MQPQREGLKLFQSIIARFEPGISKQEDLHAIQCTVHLCPCMFHQACKPIIYYHCCIWCHLQPLSGLHYCSQPGESILVLAARGRSRSSVRPLCQRWVRNESDWYWVSTKDFSTFWVDLDRLESPLSKLGSCHRNCTIFYWSNLALKK